jgi:hypothetical protein
MHKTNRQSVPLKCHLGQVLIPTELLLISIPGDQIGNFVSFLYKPRSGLSYGPYSTPVLEYCMVPIQPPFGASSNPFEFFWHTCLGILCLEVGALFR